MIEEINEQHLLYALLIAVIDDIGGIVKLSSDQIKKIASEKKLRLDLYEDKDKKEIFIELMEEEDESKNQEIT